MKSHSLGVGLSLALILLLATSSRGQGAGGHLLIVGGGLRPTNTAFHQRLVDYAGGKKARIAVLPTASAEPSDAVGLQFILSKYGVPPDQVQLVDIRIGNATVTAHDPEIVKQLADSTGIFFQGGDQTRITRSLMPDGKETPALAAIRGVWKKGGVIAGSSAGAAAQSKVMISVSGLPDDAIDAGMDALDFGLTRQSTRRGLLVTPGLAFFDGGIIDQHFTQYRGRLGRLARAACESGERYGVGIDENTGIDVFPDGSFQVFGEGHVTLVDTAKARCEDGALGCSIKGLRLSVLEEGDRFEPKVGAKLPPHKVPVVRGKEAFNGNFLIPDISGGGAVITALIPGLGDNTSQKQVGVTLKHHPHHAHGYRFTFRKTDATQFLEGYLNGIYSRALLEAQLDIEPISGSLRHSERDLPLDLSKDDPARLALVAMWRRGILCEDEAGNLRPDGKITRAELAWAIAHTLALEPLRMDAPVIADLLEPEAPESEAIALVVGKRLMELDDKGRFRPDAKLTLAEAAPILVRLADRYAGQALADKPDESLAEAVRRRLLKPSDPSEHLDRRQLAQAVYQVIGFSWASK